MNVYEKLMYGLMIIFALASNISTGITSVCIVISVLIMMIQYIKTKKLPLQINAFGGVLLLYGGLQCIIAALSVNPAVSFGDVWATMYRFIPLFFGILYLKNKKQLFCILMAFSISALLNDVYGAYQYIVLSNNRPAAFNNTATFFASHLLMAIPMLYLLYNMYKQNRVIKYYSLILMIFSMLMLIASGTRGGWIAFVIMILFSLCMDAINRKKIIAVCIGMLIAMSGINIATNGYLMNRIASISQMKDQSSIERVLMWESSIKIFEDYPVHGIGQDQFQYMYNTQYISPLAKQRGDEDYHKGHGHPHNNFFKYLSEGGLIGIVAFIMLYGFFAYKFWMLYRKEKAMAKLSYGMIGLLIMIGIQVEGLTDTNLTQVPIMREFWFLMGLLFAAGKMELEEGNQHEV